MKKEIEVKEVGRCQAMKECVGSSTECRFCSKGIENPLDDLRQGMIRCEL